MECCLQREPESQPSLECFEGREEKMSRLLSRVKDVLHEISVGQDTMYIRP